MWDRDCHCRHHDSSGVGWLLFALAMFIVAAISFSLVAIAAHLWVLAQLGERLQDRQWWRAGWWTVVLLFMLYLDGTVLASLDVS
jgi:hypothetical protein